MLPKCPAIVGPIGDLETYRLLPRLSSVQDVDWLEWRIDALPLLPEKISHIRPAILTVRHPEEGGLQDLKLEARRERFYRYLDQAGLVDVEIRSLKPLEDLVAKARKSGVPVLASFHEFRGTPSFQALGDQIQLAINLGADAVKLATLTSSSEDLFRLVRCLDEFQAKIPLSVMGMGPLGMVSRLLLAQRGSILNYGYLHQANASGQWSVSKLRQLFQDLGLRDAKIQA